MNKLVKLALFSIVAVLIVSASAYAQDEPAAAGATAAPPVQSAIDLTRYFGIGLTVIGASYGISRLASSALDGMARQPEVAGSIQTAMIIAAALIEGFTFFALVLCMS